MKSDFRWIPARRGGREGAGGGTPAAWEGLGIGSVCKAPAFGPVRGWLVGGRRIRHGGEPSSCARREKGLGEWLEGRGAGGGRGGRVSWGCRVAEDGENWSNSNRLKPSFPPIVCKSQLLIPSISGIFKRVGKEPRVRIVSHVFEHAP